MGSFVAKVAPHLQSACAAEVCRGIGVLTSVQEILNAQVHSKKINLVLGSDCQSAIHKISSTQRIVFFNNELNYKACEFLRLKSKHIRLLTTNKIAGHQDKVKQLRNVSFAERINVMCDHATKK